MNNKTVFVKTAKGEAEAAGQTSLLYGEAKRVFMLVNDRNTVDEMRKHAAPSLRPELEGILEQLARDEFIRDKDDSGLKKKPPSGFTPKIATPKIAKPPKPTAPQGAGAQEDALDFTSGLHPKVTDSGEPAPTETPAPSGGGGAAPEAFDFSGLVSEPGGGESKAAKPSTAPASGPDEIDFSSLFPSAPAPEAGQSAPKPAPEAEKKAPSTEVDFSSILSGAAPAPDKAKQEAEAQAQARAAAEAKTRAEAEARARAVAEAKMHDEAEARARAAAEAKTRAEAEARAHAEERARQEAAARARAEAEAKARMRAELEAKVRAEAAAKARAEAEAKARANAEAEAKARAAAEAKARAEAEAKARAEAEAKAKARMRAEMEAKMRAEAAAKAKAEAEARAKAEAEQARSAPSIEDIDLSGLLEPSALESAPPPARPEPAAKAKGDADAQARVRAELEASMRDVQVPEAHADSGRPAAQPSGGVASLLKDLSSMLRGGKEAPTAEAAPTAPGAPAAQETPATRHPADSGEWKPMEMPGAAETPPQQQAEGRQADREADARARQEAARMRAQQQAERARAEEEAAREAEQEAAQAHNEEAERKLAAEQAKAFAEAEKRARKAAKAEEKAQQRKAKAEAKAEAKARAQEEKQRAKLGAAAAARKSRQEAARKNVRRPGRPPRAGSHGFPIFKTLFFLIVLAVGAIVGLPNIWPMQQYVPLVEQELTSQVRQPVHIANMHIVTVPAPRLELVGVTIGKKQQLKIGRVTLYFDPMSLLSHVKTLSRVEVDQVAVDANTFAAATPWLLAAGSSEKYPVKMLEMKHARILGGVPLPTFGGKIMFNEYGKVTEANLASSDGSYSVVFQPKDRNHTRVDATITDAPLPLMPAVRFGALELVGDMSGSTIDFTSLSGNLYGGSISGVGSLSWQSGWHAQGNISFQSVVLKQALPGLKITGEMEGAATFVLNGDTLDRLTRMPRLDGTFRVKSGQIDGIDVAQTLRIGNGQAAAGQTYFDTMNGSVRLDAAGGHLRPIKIAAGALSINGSADATFDGGLSGHFLVDTSRVRAGLGTLPLRLSGTLAAPAWTVGR